MKGNGSLGVLAAAETRPDGSGRRQKRTGSRGKSFSRPPALLAQYLDRPRAERRESSVAAQVLVNSRPLTCQTNKSSRSIKVIAAYPLVPIPNAVIIVTAVGVRYGNRTVDKWSKETIVPEVDPIEPVEASATETVEAP